MAERSGSAVFLTIKSYTPLEAEDFKMSLSTYLGSLFLANGADNLFGSELTNSLRKVRVCVQCRLNSKHHITALICNWSHCTKRSANAMQRQSVVEIRMNDTYMLLQSCDEKPFSNCSHLSAKRLNWPKAANYCSTVLKLSSKSM
jgi:hypothetical protein